MGFHDVRFPVTVSFGASGGPGFKTTIFESNSGYEKRNIDWQDARARYDVAFGIRSKADMDTVREFFYARRGRAHGFRYRDWGDYRMERQSIGQTDGSTAAYQIYKTYSDSAASYDRNLVKLVSDADASSLAARGGETALPVKVWVNNVELTEGVGVSEFQVDRSTGIITLGSTHAATTGQDVEAQCEFDVPVRFDTDFFNVTLPKPNLQSWGAIPLVETRDIS